MVINNLIFYGGVTQGKEKNTWKKSTNAVIRRSTTLCHISMN